VDQVVSILDGSIAYTVAAPTNIKDHLRPIPLLPPATVQDYEFLHLVNYPLLTGKVAYNRTAGSLQIHGVLTDVEEQGSSLFMDEDFTDPNAFVQKLADPTSDPITQDVSQFLWTKFSNQRKATLTAADATISQKQAVLTATLNSVLAGGAALAAQFN